MSALDDIDDDDVIEDSNFAELSDEMIIYVGDIVLYDTVKRKFVIASPRSTYKVVSLEFANECQYILIGIVLRIIEDNVVDVLMCNFLIDCWKTVPYHINRQKNPNFTRKYMYDLFKRYVSAFRKKCPNYPGLSDIDISIIRVSDILVIAENIQTIFNNFRSIISDDIFSKFGNRLFDKCNHIMCYHNNNIYTVSFDLTKKPIYKIELPLNIKFDFLCIFRNMRVSSYPFADIGRDISIINL